MVMAKNGMKGEKGATSLRTGIERLLNSTEKAREEFFLLGGNIEAIYSDGKFKGISEIFKELERLRVSASSKDWQKFTMDMFSFRGKNSTGITLDMQQLRENLDGIATAGGFVSQVFEELSETTKLVLRNLASDFEAAFIKAFEGEKVREVLFDVSKIVQDEGFASSLEHIASGAIGISKAFTGLATEFFKLPTWIAEVGIVAAFLFGIKGKLVLGGLVLAAGEIDKLGFAMKNSVDIATYASGGLDDYKKNLAAFGKEYADQYAKISNLEDLLKSGWKSGMGEGTRESLTKKLGEERIIANAMLKEKVDAKNAEASKLKSIQDAIDEKKRSDEEKTLAERKAEQDRIANNPDKLGGETDKEIRARESANDRIKSMVSELETYISNSEKATLSEELAGIEKTKNARAASIKDALAKKYISQELADKASSLNNQRWLAESAAAEDENFQKQEAIRKKSTDAYANDLVYLENLDRESSAGKERAIAKELQTKLNAIEESKRAEMSASEAAEQSDAARAVAAHKRNLLQEKETQNIKDYQDAVTKFRKDLAGGSELDNFLSAGDKSIDNMFKDLASNAPDDVIAAARKEMVLLKKELRASDEAAILGDNPLAGFLAGIRQAQKETQKLGKFGAEVGKMFRDTLAESFKELMTGKNKNPYDDQISTVAGKIKDMQYGAIKDGAGQLAWLQKEYDSTLAGAMSGNKTMFDSYMSNLDSYLDKAKEQMNPEEYEKLYAKTMGDLEALNNNYAKKTETVWDRLGDVWGDFTDRMLDKWMSLVAEIAANEILFQIVGKTSIVGTATSSIFGGSGGSGGIGGTIIGGAWDIVKDWWGSGSGSDWGTVGGTVDAELLSWDDLNYEYADGGYIGANPSGGVIRSGSGVRDDVFLGFTGGGRTANYGMGGEFIVNKQSTAKYLPLLEQINTKKYEIGGYYGSKDEVIAKFNSLGSSLLASGMSAQEVNDYLRQLAISMQQYAESAKEGIEAANGAAEAQDSVTASQTSASTSGISASKSTELAEAVVSTFGSTLLGLATKDMPDAVKGLMSLGKSLAAVSEDGITLSEAVTAALGLAAKGGLAALGVPGMVIGLVGKLTGLTSVVSSTVQKSLASAFGETISTTFNDATTALSTAAQNLADIESFAEAEAALARASEALAGFVNSDLSSSFGSTTSATSSLGNTSGLLGEATTGLATAMEGFSLLTGPLADSFEANITAAEALAKAAAATTEANLASAEQSRAEAKSEGKSFSDMSWEEVQAAVAARDRQMEKDHHDMQVQAGRTLTDLLGLTDHADRADFESEKSELDSFFGEGGKGNAPGLGDGIGVNNGDLSGPDSMQAALGGRLGTYALGGWLGSNPGGGIIHAGSGFKDDVFLGYTNGGSTANYGMGGEYVINKRSTAKYLPLLSKINSDKFVDGGVIEDSYGTGIKPYTIVNPGIEDRYGTAAKPGTEDLLNFMEDFYEIIAKSNMDEVAKDIYDINKGYDEQLEKLKELKGSDADIAVLEQARAIKLLDIQKDLQKEQEELAEESAGTIKGYVDDAKYLLWTLDFSGTKKDLYDMTMEYRDIIKEVMGLGASFEDAYLVVEGAWADINRLKSKAAEEALSDAEGVLREAFSAERDSISSKYEKILDDLNKQLDEAQDKVSELERIVDSLDSAMSSLMGSDVLRESTFLSAQSDLRRRALTGDISGDLDKTLADATAFDTKYFGSFEDYNLEMMKSVRNIDSLKTVAKGQLDTAKENVRSLEDLIVTTEAARDAELAALDAQLNALLGIQTTVMSISEAIAQYNSAKAVAGGSARPGGGVGAAGGGVFNTSDYIQAKALDLVATGWAKDVNEAAAMFLEGLIEMGMTPAEHFKHQGGFENLYNLSAKDATVNPTTYGDSGSFNTSDYIQAKAAGLFESGYATSIEAAKEAFIGAIAKEGWSPQEHFQMFGQQEGLYNFASGGSFKVGGPNIGDNLSLPNMRVTAGEVVNVTKGDVMEELKNEIAALRGELSKVVSHTAVTAKQLSRWDGDGMPDVRAII
jgi:hypothetical protein